MKLTSEQIMEVPCIRCDAKVNEACHDRNAHLINSFHKERGNLRKRYPILPTDEGLNATDKSVLVYYAFVMLCDSCSANAEKLFGKPMSSRDIQVSFAQHALKACREDGVIKK